jgi:hypothetical protein
MEERKSFDNKITEINRTNDILDKLEKKMNHYFIKKDT